MSVSVDNFLKAIYFSCKASPDPVTGSLLASRLNISPAAVTGMSRKLKSRGLVEYTPYRAIKLTQRGEKEALHIIRKHRLWELFLFETLRMDLHEVHHEAERLEHHASDKLIDAIDKFLGYPRFDPHGESIPDKFGTIHEVEGCVNLVTAKPGSEYIIHSMMVHEEGAFDIFRHYNIQPGTRVKITARFDFDNSVELDLNGTRVLLPVHLASKISCLNVI